MWNFIWLMCLLQKHREELLGHMELYRLYMLKYVASVYLNILLEFYVYCREEMFFTWPIGSMYAIYGNIYHQYTPNVSIYTIHGSYGWDETGSHHSKLRASAWPGQVQSSRTLPSWRWVDDGLKVGILVTVNRCSSGLPTKIPKLFQRRTYFASEAWSSPLNRH